MIKTCAQFIQFQWRLFIVAIIASCFIIVAEISIPLLLRYLIEVSINKNYQNFLNALFWAMMFILLLGLGTFILEKSRGYYGVRALQIQRKKMIQHIYNIPEKLRDKYKTGDLITRINNDLQMIIDCIQEIPIIIVSPILMLISFSLMLIFSWKLTLACSILIPLTSFLFSIINKPIQKPSAQLLTDKDLMNNFLREIIEGLEIIKTYDLYNVMRKKFMVINQKAEIDGIKIEEIQAKTTPIKLLLRMIPQCVLPIYGSFLVLHGEIDIGTIPMFVILLGNIFSPLTQLVDFISRLREAKPSINRIQELYKVEIERQDGNIFLEHKSMFPVLEIKNVSFSFFDSSLHILSDVNIVVNDHSLVAVMGPSGCGKSTLLKLIMGIYENYDGTIHISGQNIKNINLSNLREQIAYMPQFSVLLNDYSISKNLQPWENTKNENAFHTVMKQTNIDEFVNRLPDLYNTKILENGGNLSVGQGQRIALGRTLLRDAALYIFDEPTSGLDTNSVNIIQNTLMKLKEKSAVLVVTHDMNLVSLADHIYEIK